MKMTERLEKRKISELIPYANNARTHSPAQIELLRRSLREFGLTPSSRRTRGLIPPR